MVDTPKPSANGGTAPADAVDDDGERKIPLSVAKAHAADDPILAGMIRRGLPLSRNAYLMLAYGPDLPEGDAWNGEHEMNLPRPFQRPLNRPMHAKKPVAS